MQLANWSLTLPPGTTPRVWRCFEAKSLFGSLMLLFRVRTTQTYMCFNALGGSLPRTSQLRSIIIAVLSSWNSARSLLWMVSLCSKSSRGHWISWYPFGPTWTLAYLWKTLDQRKRSTHFEGSEGVHGEDSAITRDYSPSLTIWTSQTNDHHEAQESHCEFSWTITSHVVVRNGQQHHSLPVDRRWRCCPRSWVRGSERMARLKCWVPARSDRCWEDLVLVNQDIMSSTRLLQFQRAIVGAPVFLIWRIGSCEPTRSWRECWMWKLLPATVYRLWTSKAVEHDCSVVKDLGHYQLGLILMLWVGSWSWWLQWWPSSYWYQPSN